MEFLVSNKKSNTGLVWYALGTHRESVNKQLAGESWYVVKGFMLIIGINLLGFSCYIST